MGRCARPAMMRLVSVIYLRETNSNRMYLLLVRKISLARSIGNVNGQSFSLSDSASQSPSNGESSF